MIERTLVLKNTAGLHARPATLLVQMVNRFPDTQVTIGKGDRDVSGKSLLSVLSLGAGAGDEIRVRCTGAQEQAAADALAALISGGFGE